jgi:hypothetical protein
MSNPGSISVQKLFDLNKIESTNFYTGFLYFLVLNANKFSFVVCLFNSNSNSNSNCVYCNNNKKQMKFNITKLKLILAKDPGEASL